MTTHHKDACPCGSGKRYKHCHMAADEARRRRSWMAGIGVLAALVVGAGAWGAIAAWRAGHTETPGPAAGRDSVAAGGATGAAGGDVSGATAPVASEAFGRVVPGRNAQAPIPASPAGPITRNPGASGALAPGEHPAPWQYDVARNRYYDPRPGHQHWHNGPPPADTTSTSSGPAITTTGGPGPIVTVGGGGTAKVTSTTQSMATTGSEALAPGENPAPWEYDKARDRYFDPRDAHRHWHAGPPPPVGQRGP